MRLETQDVSDKIVWNDFEQPFYGWPVGWRAWIARNSTRLNAALVILELRLIKEWKKKPKNLRVRDRRFILKPDFYFAYVY